MSGWQVLGSCRGSLGAGQPLFWGLVSWLSGPFGPRSLFFISRCGIVGITDLGLPCRACGQTWLLLFWLATFAGDIT